MGRALITGGAGMVGRELARLLLAEGQDPVILDIAPASKLPADVRERVELLWGDLTNWAQVLDAVRYAKVDTIYHVGALLPPGSEQNHAAAYNVNVQGTMHVLEAARLFGVGTVVYSSTTATFGGELPEPVPNDYAQSPVTMYGVTKVCSEQLGEYYHRRYDVNFRAVRFLSVMGPGRIPGVGWTAYTSLVVEECARGNPYVINVEPDYRLRFIYIKDAALSLIQLARAEEHNLTHRVYSLDGFSASTQEIVEAVRRHVPGAHITISVNPDTQRIMDTQYVNVQRRPDDRPARDDWGWKPRYTLDDAVVDFVEDVRQGRT